MQRKTNLTNSAWYKDIWLLLLLPFFLIIILIDLLPLLKARFIERPALLRRVENEWMPRGVFILFVYSDNPLWKTYAETHIIPKIKKYSIILNWSERKTWIDADTLEARIFKNFFPASERAWRNKIRIGGQDYNHVAIVFKRFENPKVINFWKAFKDYEFGRYEKLHDAENELFSTLI